MIPEKLDIRSRGRRQGSESDIVRTLAGVITWRAFSFLPPRDSDGWFLGILAPTVMVGAFFGASDCRPQNIVLHACAMGLEGIVCKRIDRPHTSGRSRDWIKIKNPDAPAVKRILPRLIGPRGRSALPLRDRRCIRP